MTPPQPTVDELKQGFTSGPWAVNPFSARVDCASLSDKGGLLPVCELLWPTDERSERETEANAHLIAAAPELYAAIMPLIDVITDGVSVAISDAELRASHPEDRRFIKRTRRAMEAARAALRLARGEGK